TSFQDKGPRRRKAIPMRRPMAIPEELGNRQETLIRVLYESGNLRGDFGTYAASDRLKVAVESGVVKYYRNGTLLYTSTVAPTYPLQVDTSLNTVNAGVYNVVITSDLQNVTWTNVSSQIQVTGNSIQKTSGTNAWDAGAISSQMI